MKAPLVSIVMTIYNEAHVVEQAIDTLLSQSYKNIELVLVDNGSKDATLRTIGKYQKKKNVKIVALKANLGPGGGRNAGAKIAKGDILVFIDADMVFDKQYINGLIKPVVEGKAVGSFHDTELVKNVENLWARSFSINRIPQSTETSGVFRAVLRKPFLKIGGFDTSRGYFDDNLGVLGPSVRAHATCYHNNPESLGEIYKHSRWVGKSLLQDKDISPRYRKAIIVSWVGLVGILALAILGFWHFVAWLALVALVLLLVFLLSKAIPRMLAERRPEYFFSIPLVWSTRLLGYYVGASGHLLRRS